jgi:hypothetical protein
MLLDIQIHGVVGCGKPGFDTPGLRDRHSFSRGICPSYGARTICIENNICFGKWGEDNI